jgi:hypothetical protein
MGGRQEFSYILKTLMGQPKMTINGPSSMQTAYKNSLKYMVHKNIILAHEIR